MRLNRIPSPLTQNIFQYSFIRKNVFQHFVNRKNINLTGLGIKKIESYVFYKCTGLEIVKLGEDLEIIEDNAFEGCTDLKVLELPKKLR